MHLTAATLEDTLSKLYKEDWSVEELGNPAIRLWLICGYQRQYGKAPQRIAILQLSTWTRVFLFHGLDNGHI